MADEKKAFTFIIVPENASKTYTIRLRRGLLYLLGVIGLLFFGSYAYVVSGHHQVYSVVRKAERLEAENEILRAQTQRVADLEAKLARLQNIRSRLYEMAGLTMGLDQSPGGGARAHSAAMRPDEEVCQSGPTVLAAGWGKSAQGDTIRAGSSSVPILWPVRGWMTAEFGEVLPGREKKHTGIDIAAPQGAPILSAASGKVTFSGWDKNLGLVVTLDHQNGLSTLYGHCSKVLVDVGHLVTQGQAIAELGNTGRSSAPHLHFEIREDGKAVDPMNYLGP